MIKKLSIKDACEFLRNIMSSKYLLVCIGTFLRGDDRACLEFCNLLKKYGIYDNIVECEFGLENCVYEIKERNSNNIAICDAVISGSIEPGFIVSLDLEDVNEDVVFASTHSIPLSLSIKLLRENISRGDIKLFGIVVENLDFGTELSLVVSKTINEIIECLAKS